MDQRLAARRDLFVNRLVEKRNCIVRQLAQNWSEEMALWRFLRNGRFGWEVLCQDMLRKGQAAVRDRCVLSIQDSSTISLQGRLRGRKGFGQMGSTGQHPGIVVHPALLLDAADGRCLGLADVQIQDGQRAFNPAGTAKEARRQEATADKKLQVWLTSGQAAGQYLRAARQVTHIADREADFFEFLLTFAQHARDGEEVIVRASQDRQLGHRTERGRAPYRGQPSIRVEGLPGQASVEVRHRTVLSALLQQLPARACVELTLPATAQSPARQARLEVRFASAIPLCRPLKLAQRRAEGQRLPGSVSMAVVDVREITPNLPPGVQPLHWTRCTPHTRLTRCKKPCKSCSGIPGAGKLNYFLPSLNPGA